MKRFVPDRFFGVVGLQLRAGLFLFPAPFFVFFFLAALYTSCVLSWSLW